MADQILRMDANAFNTEAPNNVADLNNAVVQPVTAPLAALAHYIPATAYIVAHRKVTTATATNATTADTTDLVPQITFLDSGTTATAASATVATAAATTINSAVAVGSVVAKAGQQVNVASLFHIPTGASAPTYLVVNILDRNEYTATSNGKMGSLSENGHSTSPSFIGGDSYSTSVVFTYNAATGQYINATYGNVSNLIYNASTNTNDNTSLSLFTTNNATVANSYGTNNWALVYFSSATGGNYASYLGSVSVVTQPAYTGVVPTQATASSITAAALSFVGKAWNDNGCWVLASNITAEAGASLPVTSTYLGVAGVNSGEWIVAYNGPAGQTGNWQAAITAGEVVTFQTSASSGHITTVVSGSGSTAMLVDNITYVNSSGQITNAANDGSSADIIIAAPHLASQEWAMAVAGSVVVYELDCPTITINTATSTVGAGATKTLATLFTAANPLATQAITQYQFYDMGTGGAATDSFLVGNVSYTAHTAATAVTVAASSLSSLTLLAGNSAGTDTIEVRAYNGSYWGDWASFTVTVTAPPTPTITAIKETAATTVLNAGKNVTFTVAMNTAVTVTGVPTLTLNDAGVATYTAGSGTNTLTFTYTVLAGQNTSALTVTGVNLPTGAAIKNSAGVAATLTVAGLAQTGVQIDTLAPVAPTITGDTLNGRVATVNGKAEANSLVTVYDGTTKLGTVTTNASGVWTFVTAVLANGSHALTATATDAAGNVSAASTVFNQAIVVSAAPTIANATIAANQVTLTGAATANSVVSVYDNGVLLGTAKAATNGVWTYAVGAHTLTTNNFTASALDANATISTAAAGTTIVALGAGAVTSLQNEVDTLIGNNAANQFTVYNSADTVIEKQAGNSALYAYANYTLPTNVDTLVLAGTATVGVGNNDSLDYLYANASIASTLTAGSGTDALFVTGTAGTTLIAGAGKDTFVFPKVMGIDTVTGFKSTDVLQFSTALFNNFAAAMADAKQVGANTVFTIDSHDTITLQNVTKNNLTANNFRFA